GIPLSLLEVIACGATVLVLVSRAYHRSDAIGRRQIRWAALGFYAALIPPISILALVAVHALLRSEWRGFQPFLWPSYAFAVLFPICFLIAIIRYNIVDVDRLLSATATYNLLLVVLVAIGFVLVPRVGELSSVLAGVDARIGQAAVSLLLAAVVVPAHQR